MQHIPDRPRPWIARFSSTAGYDCMTGAWIIYAANGREVCTIDQAAYGEHDHQWQDWRSPVAEAVARAIADEVAG